MKRLRSLFVILLIAIFVFLRMPAYSANITINYSGKYVIANQITANNSKNIFSVYSIKWLQLTLDELLNTTGIDKQIESIGIIQNVSELEEFPQTIVIEEDLINYGISLKGYSVFQNSYNKKEKIAFQIQANQSWGKYDYLCYPSRMELDFSITRQKEEENKKVAPLPLSLDESVKLANELIFSSSQNLLSAPQIYGYDDYLNFPYYHITYKTLIDEVPLFQGNYRINAFPERREISMGGVDIYVCGWGIAKMEAYLYDNPILKHENIAVITANQAIKVLDNSDEMLLRNASDLGEISRIREGI